MEQIGFLLQFYEYSDSVVRHDSLLFHFPFKVYFELKHHAPHLKQTIDDQHAGLVEAQQR